MKKLKVKKLTIKEYNAQIEKDAKKFAKLDKAGKRVMIAKDILLQLDSKKLIANAGKYIQRDSLNLKYDEDIKANYHKIKECKVCALGACLMATTKFNNKLKFDDIGDSFGELNLTKTSSLLLDLFSKKQLLLIECAFEGNQDYGDRFSKNAFGIELSPMENQKADNFQSNYEGDDERLRTIMENIITNKGTFKP